MRPRTAGTLAFGALGVMAWVGWAWMGAQPVPVAGPVTVAQAQPEEGPHTAAVPTAPPPASAASNSRLGQLERGATAPAPNL